MSSACGESLLASWSQVSDPRGCKGRRHTLAAMLTAVVSALLCGNRGYQAIVEWLHDLPVDVWHWMGYTRRPPKEDCFRDLLSRLDPESLEAVLRGWISEVLELEVTDEDLAAVSIDGKTLCGTLRKHQRAVHLLAAVDHQTGCVLSQCRVDAKTNEHKAALELLKEMVLEGQVVVGDAMFCQRDLCEEIVDSGGDYLFPVKENQPGLLREIKQELATDSVAFSPLRTTPA
ncbi:MAG: ISAs1 family transposase [Planctomycetota bacterium]|nr:MAG: ISAs1 family transposase [Planctomycetota bacterium]REK30372.1 MAG: ISAs1 family transposase [Planctomycetota bacterium]